MSITINYCITETVENSFTYNIDVSQPHGTNLFQFMQEAMKKEPEHFTFTYEIYPELGKYVNRINHLFENKNVHWMFYKGDTLLSKGVGNFQPQSGDHIKAKYEKM